MPLGRRTDCGDAKYAGLEARPGQDIVAALDDALAAGFDFMVAPLALSLERRPAASPRSDGVPPPPFAASDLRLTSTQWSSQARSGGWEGWGVVGGGEGGVGRPCRWDAHPTGELGASG